MPMPYEQLSNPARVVFLVTAGAFAAGELVQALRRRRGSPPADARAEVLFRLMFFGAILVLPVGRAAAPAVVIGGGVWPFALGAVLGWLGLLVRWWSFVSLGRYFTVVVRAGADQPVVDRGPYRVLRHPGYAGLLMVFAGLGLMWGNGVSAAGAVGLMVIAVGHRIRVEERALTAALGNRYRRFAAGRARLIPYVW